MAHDDIDLDDPKEAFAPGNETTGTPARPQECDDAIDEIKLVLEAEGDQRELEETDLAFDAGDQWPSTVKDSRGRQVIDGVEIPARPMLTISKLKQPCQLVVNQMRKADLGVDVHSQSEKSTRETAEMLGGLLRHIQSRSNAKLARNWSFERGAKAGRGYYRILAQYCDHGGTGYHWSDQELVIKRILNQANVFLDPYATEPDFSDGMFGQIGGFISAGEYKRRWPHSQMATMLNAGDDFDLDQSMVEPTWMSNDINGRGLRGVRVMERFRVTITSRTRVAYRNDDGSELTEEYLDGDDKARSARVKELGERIRAKRETAERSMRWMKLNAIEILEEEEWPGQWIPIIPVIGEEQFFQNIRRWVGIIRPAMDGARLFNYAATAAVEKEALDTKAPYIGYEGQFKGHESAWSQSATRNFPYLQVAPITIGGQAAPFPQRNVASPNLSGSLALLEAADNFIKAVTGQYDPSLGESKSSDSGRKVLALQQQSDTGNSHYLDNLATISMPHECRVLLDLIPHYYDRPGRLAQVLDLEKDEPRDVILNAPYVMQGGKPTMVPPEVANNPSMRPRNIKHYKLDKDAVYNAVVSVGKNYESRLREGGDAIGRAIEAAPELLKIIGDIYFKFQDFPGHMEIADRMKKMLPPNLQDNPDDENDPQALKAKLAQMQQSFGQLKQAFGDAMKQLETKQVEAMGKVKIEGVKAQSNERLAQMKVEGERMLAEIEANMKIKIAAIEAGIETEAALKLKKVDILAAREEREDEQRHEKAMAAMEHAMDLEELEVQHGQALTAMDADHAHDDASANDQRRHEHASAMVDRELDAAEAEAGRAFESTEAEAARTAESEEAEAGRAFEGEEAEAGREFESEQAQADREAAEAAAAEAGESEE